MVARKPDSPGRARSKPLKPFAQGMPARCGGPVVTISCAFLFRTRGCGCGQAPGIPCALCFEGHCRKNPDAIRAAGMRRCVIAIGDVIAGSASDEAIETVRLAHVLDCFASLAMTARPVAKWLAHPSRRGQSAAPQDEVVTSCAKAPHGEEARSAVSNHEACERRNEKIAESEVPQSKSHIPVWPISVCTP